MSGDWIDSETKVRSMLDTIIGLKKSGTTYNPLLFIDLEGVNLSRYGCISIMQILSPPMGKAHLLDVHVLKHTAFNVSSSNGTTLREILQSNEWAKVFFDVRNDSDSLFSHYQINLKGVIDLQLIEFATRGGNSRFVHGLSRCIENDLQMDFAEAARCEQIKRAGKRHFAPELGGRYEVFLERPLPAVLVEYCVQDVSLMPKLLILYGRKLHGRRKLAQSVHQETNKRIDLSKTPSFNGKGRHMAVGPLFRHEHGNASLPPQFPMNLVCSDDLSKHCTIEDVDSKEEESDGLTEGIEALSVTSTDMAKTESVATSSSHFVDDTTTDITSVLSDDERVVEHHLSETDEDDIYQRIWVNRYYTERDEESDGMKDLTACDKECGYCGECMY